MYLGVTSYARDISTRQFPRTWGMFCHLVAAPPSTRKLEGIFYFNHSLITLNGYNINDPNKRSPSRFACILTSSIVLHLSLRIEHETTNPWNKSVHVLREYHPPIEERGKEAPACFLAFFLDESLRTMRRRNMINLPWASPHTIELPNFNYWEHIVPLGN